MDSSSVIGYESVDTDRYRQLMSGFPSGVSVVTTIDTDGRPRGVTCSSLSSVTLAPPTLLVCLYHGSGTLRAIDATGLFAVNLLHAKGRAAAVTFSSPVANRFAAVALQALEPSRLPYLCEDAFAVASCRATDRFDIGDHAVLFGEVFDIQITPGRPLMYGLNRYSAWTADEADPAQSCADTTTPGGLRQER